MKILHTADLHLGRHLYGRRRHHEFAAFLDWFAATLEAERRNWSEQNRAFEQRYTDRLAIEAAKRQQAQQDALLKALVGGLSVALSPSDTLLYGGVPVWGPGARPVPPMVGQGSAYRSSPGAVNGRGAPFLSSGFQAHGPN